MLSFDENEKHVWLILSQDRFVCFDKSEPLLKTTWKELTFIHQYREQIVEIASELDQRIFMLDLEQQLVDENDHAHIQLSSLRGALMTVNKDEFEYLARAWQYALFLRTHRYCGQCGDKMYRVDWEMATQCYTCKHRCYPRVSPCIIVAIYRQNQILLAMGTRHKETGMYSTLAGFVESGESLEQAIHREVYEEVGVKVKNIRYFGSQPWPFPHSLMVGYIAEWAGGDIRVDEKEICDAQWFDINDLPNTPPTLSIAGQLIASVVSTNQEVRK